MLVKLADIARYGSLFSRLALVHMSAVPPRVPTVILSESYGGVGDVTRPQLYLSEAAHADV